MIVKAQPFWTARHAITIRMGASGTLIQIFYRELARGTRKTQIVLSKGTAQRLQKGQRVTLQSSLARFGELHVG